MYSPSAICSASRAGLLTGRFPARAGVPGNVSSQLGKAGMPESEITIAELLKSAGYKTGHVGKWHLGYTPETMPGGQGFDSSFGYMGGCIDNFSHFFYWNGPNRHDLWRNGKEIFRDGEFFLDLMVEEGSKFIEANQKNPFFLYWAINAPHYPMQGTGKWRERYKDMASPRRQYAEFVSTVDDKIGELINTLDRLGLRDNIPKIRSMQTAVEESALDSYHRRQSRKRDAHAIPALGVDNPAILGERLMFAHPKDLRNDSHVSSR